MEGAHRSGRLLGVLGPVGAGVGDGAYGRGVGVHILPAVTKRLRWLGLLLRAVQCVMLPLSVGGGDAGSKVRWSASRPWVAHVVVTREPLPLRRSPMVMAAGAADPARGLLVYCRHRASVVAVVGFGVQLMARLACLVLAKCCLVEEPWWYPPYS